MHSVKSKQNSFQIAHQRATGRPVGRPHGGWVTDLAELEKAIVLCELRCYKKFNPASVGYIEKQLVPTHDYVISDCDGCKTVFTKCKLFVKGN